MSNPFDQFATEVRAAVPDVAAPPPMDASPFGDPAAPVPTSVMNPPPQANGYGGYGAPQQQPPMGQAPNPYGAPQGGYGMPPHSDPPPMANGGDFGSPARAPPMSSFSSPPLAAPSDPFGGGAYGGYSQPPAPVPGASPPFQMPESAPAPEAAPPSPGGNPFGAPVPHQNGRMPLSPGADNPFGASPMQPKGAPPMPPQGAPPIPPMGAPPMPSQGAPPPPQQNPYGADPSQNPYGDDPSQQNPYGGNSAQQNLYGADPAQQYLYGADPAQQNPYGADPSQQSPFGAPSFQQNPYGADPSLGGQGAQPAQQQYGADPWGAQSGPGAIVPSYQPADPMAGALVPSQQQPQQQYGNVDPFSVFATSPAPAPEPAFLAIAPAPAPVPQQQPPAQTEDDLWADMGFDKPVPDPPKAEESAPATESKGGEASNATPGELPPGGEWYDARIFTPTLGVMFFKPQELTDSLFLQTDKSIVDALEERPVVAFIVEGSSARSAGVELGHVLLKVNGIDVKNPKEASRLIKEGPRPLPLLFYVPDTNVIVAEGEHMVKYDTRETTAPNSAKDWKPKYVVIGGIIAQPWMMNMYRSKSEYDIAVIETQARRPVSVKVKQFSLQGARIQNDWQGPQMVKYKNKLHPWKYIVVLPVARNPIKISSPNLSQLKPVHEGIRRVLLAQQSNRGGHGHTAAPVRGDPYARPQNGHAGGDPYGGHSGGHSVGGGGGYDSHGPSQAVVGYDGRGSHGGGDPYARGGGDPYARGGDPYARPVQQPYNNY